MSEPTPRQLHVHSVPSPAERLRTVVEIVAIVVAGVWALYTFVYEQRIKPLSEAPSFAVPTEISQTAVVNGVAFVRIRKILENTGNVPIDIAAESLSVYGETAGKAIPQSAVGKRDPYSAEIRADVPRTVRKVLYSFAKLREGAINGKPNVNSWSRRIARTAKNISSLFRCVNSRSSTSCAKITFVNLRSFRTWTCALYEPRSALLTLLREICSGNTTRIPSTQ
ncbi:MAG: hypothetical protein JO018_03650 [Candidatus Eremiobacteraeota bacterium]|nr:hypothetical protein [Candidatus Eremiobacteraeota bacterium]